MQKSLEKMLLGYEKFQEKYVKSGSRLLQRLSHQGQTPEVMVVSCCDSRVDPALIMGGDPGDFFIVRNVANIIPPYEKDGAHHGTSAALEFGICFLNVKHLIVMGHSQCGGILSLFAPSHSPGDDFISRWMDLLEKPDPTLQSPDAYAKMALLQSYKNALGFPWIASRVEAKTLVIHLWFFDISSGKISSYAPRQKDFVPLSRHAFGGDALSNSKEAAPPL
jgi:carbonic anhydrase